MAVTPYYEDESATIYHGDCLDVLPTLGPADLIVTSPPYNLGTSTGGGFAAPGRKVGTWSGGPLSDGYAEHDDAMDPELYQAWQQRVLTECWRLVEHGGAIYYNHKPRVQAGCVQLPTSYVPDLPIRQIIVWDRGSGMNFAPTHYCPQHEWVVVIAGPSFRLAEGGSGAGDVWRFPPERGVVDHPAPFPLQLPATAIRTTGARTVVDPFMGSGTTLRAAKDAGIRGIGIELSERYCEIAARRLGQEVLNFGGAA